MNRRIKISKNTKKFNSTVFLLAIMCKGFGDALIVKSNPYSSFNMVKYIILIFGIVIYAHEYSQMKEFGYKPVFVKEYYILIKGIICLAVISLFYSFCIHHFAFRSVKEFVFMTVPIVFAFLAINVLSAKQILNCAKISTVIYGISYILEKGSILFNFSLILETIKNISFEGGNTDYSKSIFESIYFEDPVMDLFCYFVYFKKNNIKWVWITYAMIILMNKRVLILFSTIILIISYVPKLQEILRKKCKKNIYIIMVIIFMILPIAVQKLTDIRTEIFVQKITGINMADFWMGRDVMVRAITASGFKSYGLGSTFDFRGSLLEIESLKFLLEVGILGLFCIVYSYWKITKNNIYSMIVMTYIFVNINTSTSIMTGAFAWIYYLILFASIEYSYKLENNSC